MEAKAVLRYIRVTPRKARMVIDLIRGRNAEEAMTILKFTPRRAARVLQRVLKSAIANATQKDMGDVDALRVSRAFVDVGPTMKRVLPRAMGRANTILKRTSHITVVIGAGVEEGKPVQPSLKVKEEKLPKKAVKSKEEAKTTKVAKAKAKAKPKVEAKAEAKEKTKSKVKKTAKPEAKGKAGSKPKEKPKKKAESKSKKKEENKKEPTADKGEGE